MTTIAPTTGRPTNHSPALDRLLAQLSLEKIEENVFRGESQDLGWGTVFGGQVLGQALSAAVQTVPGDRAVHSLHGYFLLPGDVKKPIVYNVDRIRDGGSFTTRSVSGIQSGRPIFHLSASFQTAEDGPNHQSAMPEVPAPATLPTEAERLLPYADALPPFLRARLSVDHEHAVLGRAPFELRSADPVDDPFHPAPREALRKVWLKTAAPLPDDPALHRYLLAYATDHAFLTTALIPHGRTWLTPGMQMASIDHAIWYHRPFRIDQWLLHVMESPNAHGGRGLVRGQIFDEAGNLVASTAQEGLLRPKAKRA